MSNWPVSSDCATKRIKWDLFVYSKREYDSRVETQSKKKREQSAITHWSTTTALESYNKQ